MLLRPFKKQKNPFANGHTQGERPKQNIKFSIIIPVSGFSMQVPSAKGVAGGL